MDICFATILLSGEKKKSCAHWCSN